MAQSENQHHESACPHLQHWHSVLGIDNEAQHLGDAPPRCPHIQRSETRTISSTINSGHFDLPFSDVQADQLSEFTLFPKLLTELHLRVWHLSIFQRLVSFIPGGGKPPGILSACRESRNETRKTYRFCLHFLSPETKYGCGHIPEFGVFINYNVDIIHISPSSRFTLIQTAYRPTAHSRNDDGLVVAF
jgi:hypothetical protein